MYLYLCPISAKAQITLWSLFMHYFQLKQYVQVIRTHFLSSLNKEDCIASSSTTGIKE